MLKMLDRIVQEQCIRAGGGRRHLASECGER